MDFTPMTWDQIKASQKSKRVLAFEEFREKFDIVRQSDRPEHVKVRQDFNRKVLALTPGQVHQDKALDDFAIMYSNDEYIGDQLIPEVPVKKKSDTFYKRDRRDFTGFPDDDIGGEDRAPRIRKDIESGNYVSKDHGLSDLVQQDTIDNQDAVLDEMASSVELVSEGLAFQRERRQRTLLTTPGNYAGNTTSVTAWSASGTLQGAPIADVQGAQAALWNGRGRTRLKGFTSLNVYNILARHPTLLDLFKYGAGPVNPDGLVTPQMIARVFDLDDLLIGKAREDTANIGQSSGTFSRIWPDYFGIVRVMERGATKRNNAGFAARFQYKKPMSKIRFDELKGLSGAYDVQVTSSDVDMVVAEPTGYLLTGLIT